MRLLRWLQITSTVATVCLPSVLPAQTSTPPTQPHPSVTELTQAADAALQRGDFSTAATQLKALAAVQPNDAHVQFDLGYAEERAGDETAAAAAYRAAIKADGGLAEPRLALGLLEARSAQDDKAALAQARTDLQGAAGLNSAAPELRARAWRALAALEELTDPAAATEDLLQAVKLSPQTASDLLIAGRLAEHAAAWPEAEQAYRQALALHPDAADGIEAAAGLAHALAQQNRLADAEAVLRTALAEHPEAGPLAAQMATVLTAEGKPAEAVALLEKLVARPASPPDAARSRLQLLLARAYAANGQFAEADNLYAAILAGGTNPADRAELLDARGSVLVKLGRYGEAETVLKPVAGMRAQFSSTGAWGDAMAHLAFAASKNADPRTALQSLAARATVLPETPATLFLEAVSHDTLRETKAALQAYRAFLAVANGKFPDEEFEARHRLIALEHSK